MALSYRHFTPNLHQMNLPPASYSPLQVPAGTNQYDKFYSWSTLTPQGTKGASEMYFSTTSHQRVKKKEKKNKHSSKYINANIVNK